jgi:1-acyl-sn-glycerol-3-phosphate acyltransferase
MFTFIYYVLLSGYTYLFSSLMMGELLSFSNLNEPKLYLFILLSLLISVILSIITMFLGVWLFSFPRDINDPSNRLNHFFANSLMAWGLHFLRIKLNVHGRENLPRDNKFVLVANHQIDWDIPVMKVLLRDYPISFIAKKQLEKWPIIGKWVRILGNIFIDYTNVRSGAEAIVKGVKQYKTYDVPMGIFPEGKRSRSNQMVHFKPGALKLAMRAKADILIVTLHDCYKVLKGFKWKYVVNIKINSLLKYDDYKDISTVDLSKQIKEQIKMDIDYFESLKGNL